MLLKLIQLIKIVTLPPSGMKKIGLAIFIPLLVIACKGSQTLPITSSELKLINIAPQDSISLSIEAIDLSEDMSVLSTKNDEILLLIFEQQDSMELSESLLSKRLKFDENKRFRQFTFTLDRRIVDSSLLLFLIEQDAETPIEQLEPIIRIHYSSIIEAYSSRNYLQIEKYLGDEDILGVLHIRELVSTPAQFRFQGVHKMDKFEYLIRIEKMKLYNKL